MRNAFANSITDLARKNDRIVLLSGDIGNRLFDDFKQNYPNRFFNCGVAEAGMTGISAGLASSGLLPVTYTISTFNTLRCIEQIKLDICYPCLPVVIVGTGAGLSYAKLGATHHSTDDIGMMRLLPNIRILCPADSIEVRHALESAIFSKRPTYIRLGKKGEKKVHDDNKSLGEGKSIVVREGEGIAIIGVGNTVQLGLEVVVELEKKGKKPNLTSLYSVKPLDEEMLDELFRNFEKIVILEEHFYMGGACSTILEWGATRGKDLTKIKGFGLPNKFFSPTSSQQMLRYECGLCVERIVDFIENK